MADGLLGKLRARFSGSKAAPEEDATQEQLVELFKKRNLLKRVYDKTSTELAQVKEELGELKRSSDLMRRRLDALDKMLGDPEKGQSVIVYYQLARVWESANTILAERRATLRATLEAEEQQRLLQEFVAQQRAKLADQRQKLGLIEGGLREFVAMREATERELAASQRFWHYFKRKKLNLKHAELQAQIEPLQAKRTEMAEQVAKTESEEPPKYPGLSIAGRRAVNLDLLAAAQYLYAELADGTVGDQANRAHGKQPDEVDFGITADCLKLVGAASDGHSRLANDADRERRIAERRNAIERAAAYKDPKVTLPDAAAYERIDLTIGKAAGVERKPLGPGMLQQDSELRVDVVTSRAFGLDELLLS